MSHEERKSGQPGDGIRYDVSGKVVTITLARPDKRNALNAPMMQRLVEALTVVETDASIRVVVISHEGSAFCSGMDLAAAAGASAGAQPVNLLPLVLESIARCSRPVIARVGGPARAGGIGLLAACDIAVAARGATFAFTEVRLGVVPAVISVPVLARVPAADARELFLTGASFDADRAAELRLVNVAVDSADLDATVAAYAERLTLGGPEALRATKEMLYRDAGYAKLLDVSAEQFATSEAQEGIAAFREKRPPSWTVE